MKNAKVELTPLSEDHRDFFQAWISDKEVVKYSLSLFQVTRDADWVKRYIQKINLPPDAYNRIILKAQDEKPIGYCGLANISTFNKNAEYFILIGDKSEWSKGFGTAAGLCVLHEAFMNRGLHRVWLTVSEPNIRAIKSYEKIGFLREGRMRQACFRDGAYHDELLMSMLQTEWLSFKRPSPR